MRAYKPPLRLETFAHIMVEYALRRNPADGGPSVSYGRILEEHELTIQRWAEGSAFWTPRVNNPHHPAAFRYKVLLEQAIKQLGDGSGAEHAE
jgi:hypothetical protein